MLALRKAADLVEQGGVFLRKADGLVEQEVYLRTAAGLKLIHSPGTALALDVPASAYGAGASNKVIAITTSSVTVIVSGGKPPYTYQWQEEDPGLAAWSILTPTLESTAFRCVLGPGSADTATFSVTVTDARGASLTSDHITADALNYGGLGGLII